MSMLSFDKVLKIISTVLQILAYAIGLLEKPTTTPEDVE